MKSAPVIIVQLIHIEGPMKGEIQEFSEQEISFGRHPSCHVQFPKDMTTISRKHAVIIREGNRFKLVNQGPNGTFVNGKRLEEAYLKNGDVLIFTENGPKVSFLTEMKEGEEIPPSPPSQQPEIEKSTGPSAQPEPSGPAAKAETPLGESQPEPQSYPPPSGTPQPKPSPPVQQKPVESPPKEFPSPPPPRQTSVPAQQQSIQRIQVPLIIQLGPTLRSFKELPVTIGKSPECDFILDYPAVIDHHAQIFFSQDRYWVKDLTGQQAVSINGQSISHEAPLNPDDNLALSVSGPRFRFLGGGRLAEIEEPVQEERIQEKPADMVQGSKASFSPKDQAEKVIKGAKNVLDKFLHK